MTLDDINKSDQWFRIILIEPCGILSERLSELGLYSGKSIRVLDRVIFGEPIIIETEDCRLALRRSEARLVHVEAQSNVSPTQEQLFSATR